MPARRRVPVEYRFGDSEPTAGEIEIDEFSARERVLRALGGLGMGWGAALVSVFIPVAHFLLVPIFLAGGVWFGIRRFRACNAMVAARGTCPKCGAEGSFRVDGEFKAQKKIVCGACWGDVGVVTA